MKIKVDFVTNSSSTSFMAIGAFIELDEINTRKRGGSENKNTWEILTPLLRKSELKWEVMDGMEEIMIGLPYTSMKGFETLDQFKGRVAKEIERCLGIKKEVNHIEECWRNG